MTQYTAGQEVTDLVTGSTGIVNADNGGDTVNVSWEPNEHGGYIDDHARNLLEPKG
ncbi:hypothetical protein ACGF3G_00620 [Streptomyces sp. NPDC048179]|uniref:hypothetical protein n=1 Tax=Streptomyces sp. NPDC048179 TaxID=3365506 RepID=UPI00371B3A81